MYVYCIDCTANYVTDSTLYNSNSDAGYTTF